jgi:hypothetical protein
MSGLAPAGCYGKQRLGTGRDIGGVSGSGHVSSGDSAGTPGTEGNTHPSCRTHSPCWRWTEEGEREGSVAGGRPGALGGTAHARGATYFGSNVLPPLFDADSASDSHSCREWRVQPRSDVSVAGLAGAAAGLKPPQRLDWPEVSDSVIRPPRYLTGSGTLDVQRHASSVVRVPAGPLALDD